MGEQAATKAMINELVTSLSKHFDGIHEQLTTMNARLHLVELANGTDTAVAAATRAQQEHNTTLIALDTKARRAMEKAGHAFLKDKKDVTPNSSTLALVDDVINKIFITNETGVPTAPLPPPLPHP